MLTHNATTLEDRLQLVRTLLDECKAQHGFNPLLRADDNEALEHHVSHAIAAYERGMKP